MTKRHDWQLKRAIENMTGVNAHQQLTTSTPETTTTTPAKITAITTIKSSGNLFTIAALAKIVLT